MFHDGGEARKHRCDKHNGEWNYGCSVCEEQTGYWVGFNGQKLRDAHIKKKHPVEWEQMEEAFRVKHPHVCGIKRCSKRFETLIEKERHEAKLHST